MDNAYFYNLYFYWSIHSLVDIVACEAPAFILGSIFHPFFVSIAREQLRGRDLVMLKYNPR